MRRNITRHLLKVSFLVLLPAVLGASPSQDDGLRALLHQARAAVDDAVRSVAPLLSGQELHAWDGTTSVAEHELRQRLTVAGDHLTTLLDRSVAMLALVEEEATAEARLPLMDDLAILKRHVLDSRALVAPALERHAAHLSHAGGCMHGNDPLLRFVELVQDIRATLGVVEGTLDLYGMNDQ